MNDGVFDDEIWEKAYNDSTDDYLEKIGDGDIDTETDTFKNYAKKLARLEEIRRAEIKHNSRSYFNISFKKVLLAAGLFGLFLLLREIL
jgi:hypothetical protein